MARTNQNSTTDTTYDLHPLCAAFPEMSDEDFQALKADIDDRGIVQPIVLFEGKILDGRHRARACDELGIPIPITHFPGSSDAVSFVIAMNLLRRHMSADERVAIVAKLRGSEVKAAAAKRKSTRGSRGAEFSPTKEGKAAHAIAADAKVGRDKARAALVLQDQAPDLLDEVAAGAKTLAVATREVKARTAPAVPIDALLPGAPDRTALFRVIQPLWGMRRRLDELARKGLLPMAAAPEHFPAEYASAIEALDELAATAAALGARLTASLPNNRSQPLEDETDPEIVADTAAALSARLTASLPNNRRPLEDETDPEIVADMAAVAAIKPMGGLMSGLVFAEVCGNVDTAVSLLRDYMTDLSERSVLDIDRLEASVRDLQDELTVLRVMRGSEANGRPA